MDLYTGAVGSGQVHDFNPGIRESGLFWTLPVSEDVLEVEDGTVTLAVNDLDQEDYHTLANALHDGPSDPSSVSFEMRWKASAGPIQVTDPVHKFTGKFRISTVQIEWSAKAPNFEFVSDPAGSSNNVSSVFGRERNGVFFH
ncbi:MAG TPA: hypothetical protein VGU71_03445 [Candidatus Dormibacteraeota bacterium]|nr:hypothetical protein [Candidatus Dormibacteraeota bacterium]